jgi:hypothetical protein
MIALDIDPPKNVYSAGDTLAAKYRLHHVARDEVHAIEASVMWYTEGKGEEDLGVHEFWRRSTEAGDWIDPRRPASLMTTLPPSPLSYDGQIMSIRWCLRVRAFLEGGRELTAQAEFRLSAR